MAVRQGLANAEAAQPKPEKPKPKPKVFATAHHAWTSKGQGIHEGDFLSFPKGAVIEVIKQGAPGEWWDGRYEGKRSSARMKKRVARRGRAAARDFQRGAGGRALGKKKRKKRKVKPAAPPPEMPVFDDPDPVVPESGAVPSDVVL